MTVDYATADGTATAPADYTRDLGHADVHARRDDEEVTCRSTATRSTRRTRPSRSTSRTPTNATIARRARARDDHRRRPAARRCRSNDVTVTEGDSGTVNATFTVTLDASRADAPSPSTTRPRTAPRPRRPTTRPRAGRSPSRPGQTTQTVTVPVNGDTLDEAERDFIVDLSNAVERDDRRRPGRRHDHRRRPAADVSIGDVTRRPRATAARSRPPSPSRSRPRQRAHGDRRLRDGRRHRRRARRLHGRRAGRSPSRRARRRRR